MITAYQSPSNSKNAPTPCGKWALDSAGLPTPPNITFAKFDSDHLYHFSIAMSLRLVRLLAQKSSYRFASVHGSNSFSSALSLKLTSLRHPIFYARAFSFFLSFCSFSWALGAGRVLLFIFRGGATALLVKCSFLALFCSGSGLFLLTSLLKDEALRVLCSCCLRSWVW